MVPEDVPSAHALLTTYLKQFKLAPQLSEDEFAHYLLPRQGVLDCFVVKDKSGKVRDYLETTFLSRHHVRSISFSSPFVFFFITISFL